MHPMQNNQLLGELRKHARNLLKIKALSTSREAQEFREMMRVKLLEKEKDLHLCLVEIMEAAELRLKKADTEKDLLLCEYFRAVRTDIAFILTAMEKLPRNNQKARPA